MNSDDDAEDDLVHEDPLIGPKDLKKDELPYCFLAPYTQEYINIINHLAKKCVDIPRDKYSVDKDGKVKDDVKELEKPKPLRTERERAMANQVLPSLFDFLGKRSTAKGESRAIWFDSKGNPLVRVDADWGIYVYESPTPIEEFTSEAFEEVANWILEYRELAREPTPDVPAKYFMEAVTPGLFKDGNPDTCTLLFRSINRHLTSIYEKALVGYRLPGRDGNAYPPIQSVRVYYAETWLSGNKLKAGYVEIECGKGLTGRVPLRASNVFLTPRFHESDLQYQAVFLRAKVGAFIQQGSPGYRVPWKAPPERTAWLQRMLRETTWYQSHRIMIGNFADAFLFLVTYTNFYDNMQSIYTAVKKFDARVSEKGHELVLLLEHMLAAMQRAQISTSDSGMFMRCTVFQVFNGNSLSVVSTAEATKGSAREMPYMYIAHVTNVYRAADQAESRRQHVLKLQEIAARNRAAHEEEEIISEEYDEPPPVHNTVPYNAEDIHPVWSEAVRAVVRPAMLAVTTMMSVAYHKDKMYLINLTNAAGRGGLNCYASSAEASGFTTYDEFPGRVFPTFPFEASAPAPSGILFLRLKEPTDEPEMNLNTPAEPNKTFAVFVDALVHTNVPRLTVPFLHIPKTAIQRPRPTALLGPEEVKDVQELWAHDPELRHRVKRAKTKPEGREPWSLNQYATAAIAAKPDSRDLLVPLPPPQLRRGPPPATAPQNPEDEDEEKEPYIPLTMDLKGPISYAGQLSMEMNAIRPPPSLPRAQTYAPPTAFAHRMQLMEVAELEDEEEKQAALSELAKERTAEARERAKNHAAYVKQLKKEMKKMRLEERDALRDVASKRFQS